MKYKSFGELIQAYEDDEKDSLQPIIIDNDSTPVWDGREDEEVFNGGSPEELLREVLDYLGVPWAFP